MKEVYLARRADVHGVQSIALDLTRGEKEGDDAMTRLQDWGDSKQASDITELEDTRLTERLSTK